MNLHELGIKHNCDKATHTFAGESYCDIYDRVVFQEGNRKWWVPRPFAHKNLLELGVYAGESLRMWDEYLPYLPSKDDWTIWGIDIKNSHNILKPNRIKWDCECSQDNKDKLEKYSLMSEGWNLVVDDALHLNEMTIKSFNILWRHVRSGGFYCIEDLKTSYQDLSDSKHWYSGSQGQNKCSFKNDRSIINSLLFDLIKRLDFGEGNVRAIHFYNQLIIIEKT